MESCLGKNYNLGLLTNQVGLKTTVHSNERASKKSETETCQVSVSDFSLFFLDNPIADSALGAVVIYTYFKQALAIGCIRNQISLFEYHH